MTESEDSVAETRSELVSDNRIALNRIALNRIALNRIALNRIALNRIALNRIALNRIALNHLGTNRLASTPIALDAEGAGSLLSTEDGREVLRYVVGCALPDGVTLVGNNAGVAYSFEGAIGLAPSWLVRSLDGEDQRWISACLLARVNAHDVSVQISLRGPHRALRVSDEEMATYSLEEGAFWGNLFSEEATPAAWHACQGADQAAGETGDLVDRDCAEPDPARPGLTQCRLAAAGDCGDVCRSYDRGGMYFSGCAATGRRHHDRRSREVITVFVKP